MASISKECIRRMKDQVDPGVLLGYLGFRIVRSNIRELRGTCKIHNGDNPSSFRFNIETRTWKCYSHHCEEEHGRDVIALIQACLSYSFFESVSFLSQLTGIDLDEDSEVANPEKLVNALKLAEERKEIYRARNKSPRLKTLPENLVTERLSKRSTYFIDRGFPADLLDFYEVGGGLDKFGIIRDWIPIRDEDGNLVTFSGRRLDEQKDRKYLLLESIPKEGILYNLNIARYYVGDPRKLILVEGFTDVWKLAMLGVYNVVALAGDNLTPAQARLLWKYADEIAVLLDSDEAGKKGAQRTSKMLEEGSLVKRIDLPEGLDPKNFEYADVRKYLGGMCYVS